MDSEQGKLFIGGISWETDEEKLKEHFSKYGNVSHTVVMRDKTTGNPRGFAFVVFTDPTLIDRVLIDQHNIDGRTVEAKRALSREEQQTSSRPEFSSNNRNSGEGGNTRTKKIFVGGLPTAITEDGFREYFETYGSVTDVVVMYDQQTQRPCGFGFISFDSEDAVDRVLHKTFHDLGGKQVEVKRALPKDASSGGGGGGGGRSMGGFGGTGGNNASYNGRMGSNTYMNSQTTGGGFPSYGTAGYGAPSYGYGQTNNSMGYGGQNAAYGGTGYGSGQPGGARSSWPNGPAAAYGTMGPILTPMSGQSVGSAAGYGSQGYGSQGYGYNSYGGSEGSGYGEANGNLGYANQAWGSDPTQGTANYGAQANAYGNGYGRQGQQ